MGEARKGPPADESIRICFVCLGNLCRSPTAEEIMAGEFLTWFTRARIRSARIRHRIPVGERTSAEEALMSGTQPVSADEEMVDDVLNR